MATQEAADAEVACTSDSVYGSQQFAILGQHAQVCITSIACAHSYEWWWLWVNSQLYAVCRAVA